MKRKILLSFVVTFFIASSYAQKNTAYAITGPQKGGRGWTEVRLVDLTTGEEIKSIYQSTKEIPIFNARTGKEIVRKEAVKNRLKTSDAPFATTSAACAYDKKHDRLYYTPMGINQLRYIDLKSKSPKAYFFEGESFGALKSQHDVANQITRMVIASDGNGYALTNNAENLIKFTTKKKPEITKLGAITDDPSNGQNSIHKSNSYGGDMIADASGNLYLISAYKTVFQINIKTQVAKYLGTIQGLPRGYTTNGAVVESGTTIIVSSSNSTLGYYKFDLNTLIAEKASSSSSVFNASDLANATLITKKKEKKETEPEVKPEITPEVKPEAVAKNDKAATREAEMMNKILVYPNPVTNGMVKLSFEDQMPGRYQVQFMDISGKIISTQNINVNNKLQVEEFKLPNLTAKGNYLIKIINESSKNSVINKLVVQ